MNEQLSEAQAAAAAIVHGAELKALKDKYLGDSGIVRRLLAELKSLSDVDKKERGPKIQEFKRQLETVFESVEARLRVSAVEAELREAAEF